MAEEHTDYDALWGDCWGPMQDIGPVHRHQRRLIVEMVRPLSVRSVLDVGCGNGTNLEALVRSLGPLEVWGVDVSPQALAMAGERVEGTFQVLDAERDCLERRFDLVLSSQVIEHVKDDDAFLQNLRRMTDGYCLVTTVQGRMRPSERFIGHLRNYSRAGLEEKMRSAGFLPQQVMEWGFPFYSPLYRTVIEWVGGKVTADFSWRDRLFARLLYQLYRLNSARRGDVLLVLARTA